MPATKTVKQSKATKTDDKDCAAPDEEATQRQRRAEWGQMKADAVSGGKPLFIGLASLAALAYAAAVVNLGQVETIPQVIMFASAVSIGLGGFATVLSGTASVSIGKWVKLTGVLAVFVLFFMLLLHSAGLIKLPGISKTSMNAAQAIARMV